MNPKVKEAPENYIGNLFTLGGSTFFVISFFIAARTAYKTYKRLSNKERQEKSLSGIFRMNYIPI
ncbi:hypothetical protein [Bacillus thuringiensis]|uniref:hypothetical protein n=1 Tax=Bacillus thuringiensis TaxID=1428 RepID=UPI0011A5FD5E|nr:hypothetical protein [Bacillus thuringiensis]